MTGMVGFPMSKSLIIERTAHERLLARVELAGSHPQLLSLPRSETITKRVTE
jgi:hypothetical protein